MRLNRKLFWWLSFLAVLAVGSLLLWARGRTNQVFTGIIEWRYEVSAFHPNGNCAVPSYWFDPEAPASDEIRKRWLDLGRPKALHVTFVGDLFKVGQRGHLGGYVREVRAVKLIEISTSANGCG